MCAFFRGATSVRALAFAVFSLGAAHSARAGLVIESSMIYGLSTVNLASNYSTSHYFGGVFAGATMSKHPFYLIGFRVDAFSQTISATNGAATTTLGGLDYGAHIGMILGKSKAWHIGASYFPYVTGTAAENGTSLGTYYGTGYQGEVAFAPRVGRSTFLGGKLAYRAISVKRIVTESDTSETVTYSASTLIPTLFISIRFGEE